MTTVGEQPTVTLRRLTNGYQVSQAIHVAATLGIADVLAQGPRTSDELAAAVEAHPEALYRVLRALASVDVLQEEEGRRFALTDVGECLRADHLQSVAGWAAFIGQPYYWDAWANLLHGVRTGENAFRHLHGISPWEYRAERPDLNAAFNRAMTDLSRRANAAIVAAYDFGRFRTIVDVGGGQGAFLGGILAANPGARGILFDQPHVVAGAEAVLRAAGVADRCEVVGGSFFESAPAGGDAYALKAVIHDWPNAESAAILRVVRRAMGPEGTLLVVEQEVAPPNEGAETKFSDLNMLVALDGRERTREEFAALFELAGFRLVRSVTTGSVYNVIEGVPA